MIGCYHFVEEHYELAHAHLLRAQELLTKIKGHCEVEKSKLTGYLLACEGVLGRGRGRDDEGRDSDVLEEAGGSVKSPAGNLEKYMLSKDYKVAYSIEVCTMYQRIELSCGVHCHVTCDVHRHVTSIAMWRPLPCGVHM